MVHYNGLKNCVSDCDVLLNRSRPISAFIKQKERERVELDPQVRGGQV